MFTEEQLYPQSEADREAEAWAAAFDRLNPATIPTDRRALLAAREAHALLAYEEAHPYRAAAREVVTAGWALLGIVALVAALALVALFVLAVLVLLLSPLLVHLFDAADALRRSL